MKFINPLLQSFEFRNSSELFISLVPSTKYNMTLIIFAFTGLAAIIEQLFGMSVMGLIAFIVVMPVEVISGVKASKQPFSSKRFSRFLFKLFYYMVLIFVTHNMAMNYEAHNKMLISGLFDWMNAMLVLHITSENVVSILENIAVIEEKPKSFYINLIRNKVKNVLGDGK